MDMKKIKYTIKTEDKPWEEKIQWFYYAYNEKF